MTPFLPYLQSRSASPAIFGLQPIARSKNTVIGHCRREEDPPTSAKALCCKRNIPSHGLANHTGLRIYKDNERYTKWLPRAPNPKVLEITDLTDILHSRCHFDRKFESNSRVLEELDPLLDHQ